MDKIGAALAQVFSLEQDREMFNNLVHSLDNDGYSLYGAKS